MWIHDYLEFSASLAYTIANTVPVFKIFCYGGSWQCGVSKREFWGLAIQH